MGLYATSKPAPGNRVLLVEDDPAQLQKLSLELEIRGMTVLPTRNGLEALHFAKTEPLEGIISDIFMPLIDGYQLCRILKDDPATAHIPILLLTGTPQRFSGLWALTCGADQLLTKAEFSAGIATFLERLHAFPTPAPPVPPKALPGLEELQTQLKRTLEEKLLESGVRQGIHGLCKHVGHPAQMAWAFLDLVKEIAFPGAVYVAWPGPKGDHLFLLESEGFPDFLRARLEAQLKGPARPVAKLLRRETPCSWPLPESWEGLEFRVPAMGGAEGRWGLFSDPQIFKTHRGLLKLIDAEVGLVLQNVLAFHQLLRANAELRSTDLSRSELLQVITHEIRSPLTAVNLYMDLLGETFLSQRSSEEQKGFSEVQGAVARLLNLINCVLDLERSAHQPVHEENSPVDLHSLTKTAMGTLSVLGKGHGVTLQFAPDSAPEGAGGQALGNPVRLLRCFVNLVTNAIKYSPIGGTVQVRILEKGEWARVEIQDQGPGVPEDFLEELFTPFHQADSDHGGSGLGLSITRSLLEDMGGRVGCQPAEPRGTIFWFELPAAQKPSSPQ